MGALGTSHWEELADLLLHGNRCGHTRVCLQLRTCCQIGKGRDTFDASDLGFLPDTADLLQVSADLADRSRSPKPWGSQIN